MKVAPEASPADFYAESIFDVDFAMLRMLGIRGVLLDVDNTLAAPRSDVLDQRLIRHLSRELTIHRFDRCALASNARRDLSQIAACLNAEIVKAGWLIAKPRMRYFRRALAQLGMSSQDVVIVGDKALHDILPASRLGIRTVLVRPVWPDQLIDRLLVRRHREQRIRWVRESGLND